MKDKKKIIISVSCILSAILITIGITVAIFTYTKTGDTQNTITTGKLTFLYTENTGTGSGINITDAFPVSDELGKAYSSDSQVFDFKVESEIVGNAEIPYEVTVAKTDTSTLGEEYVKIYLTDTTETEEVELLEPTLYSNLPTSSTSENEKQIYFDVVETNEDYEKDFRLRMWIDENSDQEEINEKTFTVKVGVYSPAELVERNIPVSVTAKNSSGEDLNASAFTIEGERKGILLEKLVETGYVSNTDEVDALIEVKSNEFDDISTTTFDVSEIAHEGDKVVILHYNEEVNEWEYIGEDIVSENGTVTGDFTSFSPVAFVVINDSEYEVIAKKLYTTLTDTNNNGNTDDSGEPGESGNINPNFNFTSSNINFNVSSMYSESLAEGTSNTIANIGTVKREYAGLYRYEGLDNVYFYRGSVNNNNVIFNNMCWKIIRTTETKGIRIIYNGTPVNGKCEVQTGNSTMINNGTLYQYNNLINNKTYADYKNSKVKTVLENWYVENMLNVDDKLEDVVVCSDITNVAYNNSNLYVTDSTWTMFPDALKASYYTKVVSPSLVCSSSTYMYTKANGGLSQKVGLLTASEQALAGGTSGKNKNDIYYLNSTYYLYNGASYWTSSPIMIDREEAYISIVLEDKCFADRYLALTFGLRPVVSLKAGTAFTNGGNGTPSNPYVVK